MAIDRKEVYRLAEVNPISRVYAADNPDRDVDAGGMAMAREGYSVLDRSSPNAFRPERRGMAQNVNDRPNVSPDEEQIFGQFTI